ncbi:hypothetical protein ACIRP2_08700 [Streptomyces sp. NPDC101194]|uniref:hypothetical protein n=1 Tax=Streptomyces sp. NPDC101194 TaxID=3366127 RepID=UPI0038008911
MSSRMLLRTLVAALSTLSFLVFGTSPTAHGDTGTDLALPSGTDSTHRVHAVEAWAPQHTPGPLGRRLVAGHVRAA